jgi:hypothetical protein
MRKFIVKLKYTNNSWVKYEDFTLDLERAVCNENEFYCIFLQKQIRNIGAGHIHITLHYRSALPLPARYTVYFIPEAKVVFWYQLVASELLITLDDASSCFIT